MRQCAQIMAVLAAHGIRLAMLDVGGASWASPSPSPLPAAAPSAGSRALVPCILTGPSCDSQDAILDRVWLPTPCSGDQVLIGNAGAYTTCYSGRSAFNGYPAPAVKITKFAA